MKLTLKMLNVFKLLILKQLTLHLAKKVFHTCIVKAVAFSGHAYDCALTFKSILIILHCQPCSECIITTSFRLTFFSAAFIVTIYRPRRNYICRLNTRGSPLFLLL
jgi:hypothetical protein